MLQAVRGKYIERGAVQLGWELDTLLEKTLQAMAESEDEIKAQMEILTDC